MNKVEKKPATASFQILVSSGVAQASYQKQLKKVAESAELKGFRKGKAPLELVEKQVDKQALYNSVLDEVLPPVYLESLKKENIIPLSEPRIIPLKMEDLTKNTDWTFQVEVAVKPDFTLGNYRQVVKKALAEHAKVHSHEGKPQKGEEDSRAKDHTLGVIFDALLKEIKFEVSPILVEDEQKNALSRLVNQLSSLKLTVPDYLKSIKKTEAELVKEYEHTAMTNLKLEFILQAIVEDLKPAVSDEEVAALKPAKGQESYARYLVGKRKALDNLLAL